MMITAQGALLLTTVSQNSSMDFTISASALGSCDYFKHNKYPHLPGWRGLAWGEGGEMGVEFTDPFNAPNFLHQYKQ